MEAPAPFAGGRSLERLKLARAEKVKFATGIRELLVLRELPEPKQAFVPFALARHRPQEPTGPGEMAVFADSSADRASDGESFLALHLRPEPGPDHRGFSQRRGGGGKLWLRSDPPKLLQQRKHL